MERERKKKKMKVCFFITVKQKRTEKKKHSLVYGWMHIRMYTRIYVSIRGWIYVYMESIERKKERKIY